jgi:hypothetical protein
VVFGLQLGAVACSPDSFASTDAATGADAPADVVDGSALPVPEKIAEELGPDGGSALGRVAVDTDFVYWIREDVTTVKRTPKAGGPTETVKPSNAATVDDLALGPSHVFTNGFNGGPFAYAKGGGLPRGLPLGCPSGLRTFVAGTFVYYTLAECNGGSAPLRVVRADLEGDAGQIGTCGAASSEIYGDVVADAKDVFVVDNGGVGRLPPDLSSYALLPSQAGAPGTALALDDTNLFVRRSNGLSIVNRVSPASVDTVPLAAEAIPIALNAELRTQLAQDGAYVYVSARTGLFRIAKAAPHAKTTLYDAHGTVGVAQDAGYVYFSVPDLGAILRVKKPG